MSADERIRRGGNILGPMLILGAVMSIAYIILGSYILLDKSFLPKIPTEFRNIFAGMLLIYGLYRGWRIWSDYKAEEE